MTANHPARKILAGVLLAAFAAVGAFGIFLLLERIDHYQGVMQLPEDSRARYRGSTITQITVLAVGLALWLYVMIQALRRYVAWCRSGPAQAG
jgi:uncharacterized membrane protein YecN with MAPEG domain